MDNPTLADVVAEYRRVMNAARDEYRRVMDAAWGKYHQALNAAWCERTKALDAALLECIKGTDAARLEYVKAVDAAHLEYTKAVDAAWGKYLKAPRAARDKYRKVLDAAWNAVATKTSDPLARWIIKNCSEYQEEGMMVLEALPASLEELDDMAHRMDWCEVWDEFVAQAQKDGVI